MTVILFFFGVPSLVRIRQTSVSVSPFERESRRETFGKYIFPLPRYQKGNFRTNRIEDVLKILSRFIVLTRDSNTSEREVIAKRF